MAIVWISAILAALVGCAITIAALAWWLTRDWRYIAVSYFYFGSFAIYALGIALSTAMFFWTGLTVEGLVS